MRRSRRLKHWGWGFEDQAPTQAQLREAAEGIRARFGFGGEVRAAVPLEEVEVRAPRRARVEAVLVHPGQVLQGPERLALLGPVQGAVD